MKNDDVFTKKTLIKKVTKLCGYTDSIGVEVELVERGRVILSLSKKAELTQFNGYFHGGVISGLADHAAGAAATTVLPDGRIAVTVELNIHYMAPANAERLLADATVESSGDSLSVVSVRVSSESGDNKKLCSLATVTLVSMKIPNI